MKLHSCLMITFQLLLVIVSFVFYGDVLADELEVPFGYDLAWVKTAQAISLEGVTISTKDKELGIMQGAKSCGENSLYFTCPRLKGREKSFYTTISATVGRKTETTSVVTIKVEGVRKSYRNKHFVFITIGRVHSEDMCKSTGEFEKLIFNNILNYEGNNRM